MDYITKPVSRDELRKLSKLMRRVFGIPLVGAFPVLRILDQLRERFNTIYEIVEDSELPPNVMAQCTPRDDGGYKIQIKESVYDDAYRGDGASLGFICHEICHVFLFLVGYKPVFERSFEDRRIEPFRSVEWQAKALCGEVMIPYEESANMDEEEVMRTYKTSRSFARYRIQKLG